MKTFKILMAGAIFAAGTAVALAQESNSTPITTPATDAAHPGAVDAGKPTGIQKPGDNVTPVANATSTAQAADTPGDSTRPVSLDKSQQKDQKKVQKSEEKSATEQAKAQKANAKAMKHADKSTDASEKAASQQNPQ